MTGNTPRWLGKIIGGVIGLLVASAPGLIVGILIGHLFDAGYIRRWLQELAPTTGHNRRYVQDIFFNTTFLVMGYLAKSDGHVSQQEINAARRIMQQMQLNEALKREAIQCFYRGKRSDFNLQNALDELRQACRAHPSLLQAFLEVQVQMAQADGYISPARQAALQDICHRLGVQSYSYQQQHQQAQYQSTSSPLAAEYQLLEISPHATDDEVKKAYRRMMSKYHPDRLMAKGVPQEMINLATQKTQQIKTAYEKIKKQRKL